MALNGLIVGNIYALLAVGLALIFGVSHLINFAHGSVYMVGAFIGWLCLTRFGLPLPAALACIVWGTCPPPSPAALRSSTGSVAPISVTGSPGAPRLT